MIICKKICKDKLYGKVEQKRQNKQKGNKKISHINMQHILQRLKESKKIKIKRENMQHILQIPKRLKTEESDFLHRISQLKTGG